MRKELTLKRMECNEEILKLLTDYIHANPDIRFGQALLNLNIVEINFNNSYEQSWKSEYNTEPDVILKRMKE